MPDALDFAGMIQSLKAVTDIAKALVGIRDAAVFRERVAEMNREIIAAQSSALAAQQYQSTLLERVNELEKQVTDLEARDAEKERYILTEVRPGAYAYASKESASTLEPPHYLCTNCYPERHKSILQKQQLNGPAAEVLICNRCAAVVYLSGNPGTHHVSILPKRPNRR